MEITISKTDFENALPIGKSASDDVFNMVSTAIETELAHLEKTLLGEAGKQYMEKQGQDSYLMKSYKKTVCVRAFLSVMRQLDLVLTPTGFGIVSNDNVSPASKQRVDALEGQLRTLADKFMAMTVNLLRSENWGATEQARKALPWLYDAYTFYFDDCPMATWQDWSAIHDSLAEAHETLKTYMGYEMLHTLMDAFRRCDSNVLASYGELRGYCLRVYGTWPANGKATMKTLAWRLLFSELDSDEDKYKLYRESKAYNILHHEKFRNTKDSSGYVFNG